jgi:hypothetical protein
MIVAFTSARWKAVRPMLQPSIHLERRSSLVLVWSTVKYRAQDPLGRKRSLDGSFGNRARLQCA